MDMMHMDMMHTLVPVPVLPLPAGRTLLTRYHCSHSLHTTLSYALTHCGVGKQELSKEQYTNGKTLTFLTITIVKMPSFCSMLSQMTLKTPEINKVLLKSFEILGFCYALQCVTIES
jgi:hypothetical protein